MPCEATAFLIVNMYQFMPHIQDTRGNSSFAFTKISFENNMYKAFAWGLSVLFRDPQKVNIVKADHCIHLDLWWHQVF